MKYFYHICMGVTFLSPSSRGRGLKFCLLDLLHKLFLSPSSRGRGLKYCISLLYVALHNVALFTRAWIEMCASNVPSLCGLVALFTRAWIEITSEFSDYYGSKSPSSRGRGLKYYISLLLVALHKSPSSRGRGLKSIAYLGYCGNH